MDFLEAVRIDSIPEDAECAHFAYYYLGDKQKAIDIMNAVLEKNKEFYDAACLYSVMDDKDKALAYLRQALQNGFCRFNHIRRDRDLDNIRNTPEFKNLILEFENKMNDENKADERDAYSTVVEEIPFTGENGMCNVKCSINGLPLRFIFDTGASTISVSSIEAAFMLKNGYLSSDDIIGSHNFTTADGSISEGTVVNLRTVKFGNLHLNNIRASVVRNQSAPLLLGQSVLARLGKVEVDNGKKVLRVEYKERVMRK